ncbi:MAG: protein kinase [Gemmatimonadetes bacterium]|nr:protein kinase [Gemmatimonadota bacterium]
MPRAAPITSFNFEPGRILAGKYEVLAALGAGIEGEVYLVEERETGIHRAAKFFFSDSTPGSKTIRAYAQKLHRLRECPIVMQFVTPETMAFRRQRVSFLVSEYVDGELLSEFVMRQRGKRLPPFEAVHLLHALASGMEFLHNANEYHGDLHWDNVIVQRFGLRFDLKLVDVHLHKGPRPKNIQDDVIDLIAIFHEVVGGRSQYAKQPPPVKDICCGLKHSLILKKYRNAGQLRQYLEEMTWG